MVEERKLVAATEPMKLRKPKDKQPTAQEKLTKLPPLSATCTVTDSKTNCVFTFSDGTRFTVEQGAGFRWRDAMPGVDLFDCGHFKMDRIMFPTSFHVPKRLVRLHGDCYWLVLDTEKLYKLPPRTHVCSIWKSSVNYYFEFEKEYGRTHTTLIVDMNAGDKWKDSLPGVELFNEYDIKMTNVTFPDSFLVAKRIVRFHSDYYWIVDNVAA